MNKLAGTMLTETSSPLVQWVWRGAMLLAGIILLVMYSDVFDYYEVGIVVLTAFCMGLIGQNWLGMRWYIGVVGVVSLFAIQRYADDLSLANSDFFLNYMLASQSAFMWMSALFVMATLTYFAGLFLRSEFTQKVGTALTWSASAMGLIGLMVRWRESYLIGPDVGHIPVSNLYEVFILFAIITSILYLFYERRYQTRALGGFVLLVISSAVAFQLWYTFSRWYLPYKVIG